MNLDPNAKAPLSRRVLGSAVSAWIGWLALNVLMVGVAAFSTASAHDWLTYETIVAMVSLAFISATWLIVLLPLYLLVPLRNPLWRWYICTPCGAVAGASIMYVFCLYASPHGGLNWFGTPAAFTGAATCLFASLTSRRFHLPYGVHSPKAEA